MGARGVYPRRLAWRLDNGRHYRREPRRLSVTQNKADNARRHHPLCFAVNKK
nr:MAG TPA: hypothetical protein [Caudoviricetes sp.]